MNSMKMAATPTEIDLGTTYSLMTNRDPIAPIRSPLSNFGVISLVLIIILLVLVLVVYYYKSVAGDPDKWKKTYKIHLNNEFPITSISHKEIRSFELKPGLRKELGKGNFGVVHLESLIGDGEKLIDVAVKRLRDNATPKEINLFIKEIEMMRHVGFHDNIVSMIGSYPDSKKPKLILEYCPYGDLHTYLRNQVPLIKYGDIIYDLLSYGRQVAIGMDYLASKRVIHRDLAARNVLLCHDKKVKISDFGLSRNIYPENIYRPVNSGAMPIKWMAPESLIKDEYSTASDVWSFGVFLWELVTLGGDPYPDLVTTLPEFKLKLKAGYRMASPCPSHPQLYEIMRKCWHEEEALRPEFSNLRDFFDKLCSTP